MTWVAQVFVAFRNSLADEGCGIYLLPDITALAEAKAGEEAEPDQVLPHPTSLVPAAVLRGANRHCVKRAYRACGRAGVGGSARDFNQQRTPSSARMSQSRSRRTRGR